MSMQPNLRWECPKCGSKIRHPRDAYCGYCLTVIDWDSALNLTNTQVLEHEKKEMKQDLISVEEQASELLNKIDFTNYKYPWMAKIIELSLEYLTLDGLQDALRGSQIPDEILDICESKIKD